jgi:hypothetical protein
MWTVTITASGSDGLVVIVRPSIMPVQLPAFDPGKIPTSA